MKNKGTEGQRAERLRGKREEEGVICFLNTFIFWEFSEK